MSKKCDDEFGPSTHRQRRCSGAPASNSPIPPSDNDDKRCVPDGEDLGVYASYGEYLGRARLLDAAIRIDEQRIAKANPTNWENVKWLAGGAFELGSGQIVEASMLLAAMDVCGERAPVGTAINKFDFDATRAADVLAARAYVWAQSYAPSNYPEVPRSGSQLESVSESIMAVELARPGTLYLALQGDEPSGRYISFAVKCGLKPWPGASRKLARGAQDLHCEGAGGA